MPRDILLSAADSEYIPYDLDRSGSLSATELERVIDTEIVTLLEDRLNSGRLTERQAAEWILSLSASKGARVLGFFDDRRSPSVFREAFRQNAAQSLRIVHFSRESVGEPAVCRGREASSWLRSLTPEERATALWLLSVPDPAYAAGIVAAFRPGAEDICASALEAVGETIDRPAPAEHPDTRPTRTRLLRERTTVVPMRAYALADADTRDGLLTADVSTCTVLTLYDPVRRVGVMAHFDVNSDYQNSLDTLFADLATRGVPRGSLVARIVGGNASFSISRRLAGDLEERLRLEGVSVLEAERDGSGREARSFFLDLRTGDLESYRGPYFAVDATARDEHHPSLLARTGN